MDGLIQFISDGLKVLRSNNRELSCDNFSGYQLAIKGLGRSWHPPRTMINPQGVSFVMSLWFYLRCVVLARNLWYSRPLGILSATPRISHPGGFRSWKSYFPWVELSTNLLISKRPRPMSWKMPCTRSGPLRGTRADISWKKTTPRLKMSSATSGPKRAWVCPTYNQYQPKSMQPFFKFPFCTVAVCHPFAQESF